LKYYITTPIYYVNDRPHLGHAYTTVAADVLARWRRSKGEEVFFLTGTDEHGAKVAQAAKNANQNPREFCDEKARSFKNAWQRFGIEYSNFIRTTDAAHEAAVQKFLQALFEAGYICKARYKGLYCQGCEQYKIPDDLIEGLCPDHQTKPQEMEEESYFFKLSKLEKDLEQKIESDEIKIRPVERKNEVLSFIKSGLKDISISRKNVKWGIPLPFDAEHTAYVWVDAFLNYLTGLGWDGSVGEDFYKLKTKNQKLDFWPPDLQLMAKDIVRVHATIWLGLLLALKIPPPKNFFVHGFFTLNGQKMSKSLGNVIWPEELTEKFGADAARFLLLSFTPFGQDGDISWEKMAEKYNSDLADGLGNLTSRVFNLIEKNFDGKIEATKSDLDISYLMKDIKIYESLLTIKEKIEWANKYIDENKVWELVKNDKEKGREVLSRLLGAIVAIGEALAPFMPKISEKILARAKAGKIKKGEILFPKIV